MSTLEVNTLDSVSGTSTLTIGGSNAGTIALGSGDVQSNFLYPAFHVVRTSTTGIAHATTTTLTYDTTVYDTNSAFSGTNTFTIPSGLAGKYYFYCNQGLDGSAPSRTFVRIAQNGTGKLTVETGSASSYSNICVGGVLNCSVGDTITSAIYHDAGSTQNCHGSTARAFFGGYRIGT